MNKKRIILGLLIAVVAVICGAFIKNTPQVFAVEQPQQQIEAIVNVGESSDEAGTYYGQGYYTLGQTATLRAEMNPGYEFDAWIAVDGEGGEVELSNEEEYTFVVDKNITIKPTWHKIEYNVTFSDDLYIEGETELKDFTYQIVNKTENGQPYYYNSNIEILLNIRSGRYIYNLENDNITINGTNVNQFIGGSGSCVVSNNDKTGFSNVVIGLNITEDIEIDINYIYMYALQVVSGNAVNINEIMPFVTISNHYSQPNANQYIYLVRADKQVNVVVSAGDTVYKFAWTQFQDQEEIFLGASKSYTLVGDSTLTVVYTKIQYTAAFNSYITNLNGINDLLATTIYAIDNVKLSAGDTIGFEYDNASRNVTITDVVGAEHVYTYANDVYGYKFVGFAINNTILTDDTYTLSETEPDNIEIQLIFNYIEYDFQLELVDSYFEHDVNKEFKFNNSKNKLVVGTEIDLKAETSIYKINGWSWSDTPKYHGYIIEAESDASSHQFTLTFQPVSDDNSQPYILYLDVDYKYSSTNIVLKSNSIVQNLDYDVVIFDNLNKILTFSDSDAKKTAKIIEYTDADVTIDGTKTIITTTEFGNVEIEEGKLSYSVNSLKQTSISETSDGTNKIYTFNKYTYFGELKLSTVQQITLSETASDVTFVLKGTTYTHQGERAEDLLTKTTTKTEETSGVYKINYIYPMYLYMNGAEYDYIMFRNVKFDYDGEKFVLKNAVVNAPDTITSDATIGLQYGIQLNNLLPNTLLMYSTKTTNVDIYQFKSITNHTGTGLLNFVDNGYNACILNSYSTNQINVEYRQLSDNIDLLINIEKAYAYENITISVQHDGTTTTTTGNTVSAANRDIVTIAINSNLIYPGYKFNNYLFKGLEIAEDTNADVYVLTFVMELTKYAKQQIRLDFSPIEYTLKINYINSASEIINKDTANGKFKQREDVSEYASYIVKLPDESIPECEYKFEAIAQNGYYVKKAYTGTETYSLTSLITDNASTETISYWTLTEDNFVDAIVTPAGEGTEVNLYIYFAIHTYSVKIYFEIEPDNNASDIEYPVATINGIDYEVEDAMEEIDGFTKTRYFALADGIDYNLNVNIQLGNFMLGTSLSGWTDAEGNGIQDALSNSYLITAINQNTVLRVILKYTQYTIQFNPIDEEGRNCSYGTAQRTTVKMYETVRCDVTPYGGYILKEKYYLDSEDKKTLLTNNSFVFDPANYKLEASTVNIYCVFAIKTINLTIGNTVDGFQYYYDDKKPSELATYTVSRIRNGVPSTLNDETGYEVKTGDIITMRIDPISIGVKLDMVKLHDKDITFLSEVPNKIPYYKLALVNITDGDGKTTGVYYTLEIEFRADVIAGLPDNTNLQNVLKVKEYDIEYTHNYMDSKEIKDKVDYLLKTYNPKTLTSLQLPKGKKIYIEDLGFGTEMHFKYVATSDVNFKVVGYYIDNIKLDIQTEFIFADIELWKQVALNRYIANSDKIIVKLILQPEIILKNHNTYSPQEGYTYQRQYIGAPQGLTTNMVGADVMVGGEFEIVITYSYDGITYIDSKPINVGTYLVKLVAKISNNNDVTDVEFAEQVTFEITPAPLTIKLADNTPLPISKTYDGSNSFPSSVFVKYIEIVGEYPIDEGNVFVDEDNLSVQFEGSVVNSNSNLYDITVSKLMLLNGVKQTIKNYEIKHGTSVIFENIGKINPRDLHITGFVVKNKVYDPKDNSVDVDISGIGYVGLLAEDFAEIHTENLKFYISDNAIGPDKAVLIDWSTALDGADKNNYTITYDEKSIDVHPYELTYILKDYGTFKIVDDDKLCLIPIGARMIAEVHDKGSAEYRSVYTIIEPSIAHGQKLKNIYEITMRVGVVDQLVPQGLYIYIPKLNKVTKVLQVPDGKNVQELKYLPDNDYTIIKVNRGEALFGVIIRTTYLPLWAIILIVLGCVLVVGIFVLLFIIIRRKTKQKYSKYDKI